MMTTIQRSPASTATDTLSNGRSVRTNQALSRGRFAFFAGAVLTVFFVLQSPVLAHIIRAEKQFSDIAQSDARFDIGFLAVVGIIPGTPKFEPDKPLTKLDLAAWAAMSKSKAAEEKKPDINALAKSTLAAGGIDSLEGPATFADITKVFFNNQTSPERANETPTKAEAARFLVRHLSTNINGITPLQVAGLKAGPDGKVSAVQAKTTEAGGKAFFVTIGETTLPMYAHGRVGAGPVDISQWKDHTVRRSLIRTEGGHDMWMYLEAAEPF